MAVVLGLAAAAASAPPALAAEYAAKWIGQSEYPLLESGERSVSFFVAQNTGTRTWTSDVVRLGTTYGYDRASVFADESWLLPSRPTALDEPSVPPGATGRFEFTVRAPSVDATQVFREAFAPVAEGIAWMQQAPDWDPVYLDYTVVPAVPPAVAWTAAPDAVERGTPATVSVSASDNRRVDRVEFRLAAGAPSVDAQAPYDASVATTGLARGTHTLEATAVDGAGNRMSVTRPLTLTAAPNGNGASDAAVLKAGFGQRGRRARTTKGFGRAVTLRGRLTDAAGRPIGGAALELSVRTRLAGRTPVALPPATTGANGRFAYRLPRGPSRDVEIRYRAFAGDAVPAATRALRALTRAGVRLRVSRRRVQAGGRVSFAVRLRGRPFPRRRAVVVLQGHQPGFGWRTFATARGHGRGYRARYRFQRASGVSVRVRAVVAGQAGYPYATGRSRAVRIRVG